MKTIPHFINGQRYDGSSSRYADGFNPATGEVTSSIPLASNEDVALAVASAKAAFPAWSETPALKRARILFNFKALLDEHQDELAELITREHGKVFSDARVKSPAASRSSNSPAAFPICSKVSIPTRSAAASTTGACARRSAWWPASRPSTSP